MVADGERDEPWLAANDGAANEGGRARDDGDRDGPIELTDEAARLDLDDDDPPLPWLQGDDDDEDFEGSGLGQTIGFVVLGLMAIALVVGGIWWVSSKSDDQTLVADGSTIPAPKTPYKEKPKDPGGKVFEGTGDTSFGISEGQKRPARLGQGEGGGEAAQPGFTSVAKGSPAPAASTEAPVAGVGVQVAAYSNQKQAEDGWASLSQKYEILSGVKHRVVQGQADIGTVYRLQAVAPDAAAARELCGKLKAAGLNCQVKN